MTENDRGGQARSFHQFQHLVVELAVLKAVGALTAVSLTVR
jgi:hypothetical protein